jgi:hypothetical protein
MKNEKFTGPLDRTLALAYCSDTMKEKINTYENKDNSGNNKMEIRDFT